MSNILIRAAQRVQRVCDGPVTRAIRASENAVLIALADDARDHQGGRSRLTTRQVRERTRLSERAVRLAYAVLVHSGHITRELGDPGEASTTLVHPRIDLPAKPSAGFAGVQPLHGGGATIAWGGCNHCTPLIDSILPLTKETVPSARAIENDEVEEVFDRWDAIAEKSGLPGPVARDAARRTAVAQRIGAEKLWRVLALVESVGADDFLTGRKRRGGQSNWLASFDWVFEVGPRFAGSRVFQDMIERIPREPPRPRATAPPPRPEPPLRVIPEAERLTDANFAELRALLAGERNALRVGQSP